MKSFCQFQRRRLLALCVPIAGAGLTIIGGGSSMARNVPAGRPVVVKVGGPTTTHAIPAAFAGLSVEWTGLEAYAGNNPASVDPVFEQLIRNITPGQQPVLRIGGDTTDWTWWPVLGTARPPWVRYTLNDSRLAVMRALSQSVGARFIPGINLEANSPSVAAAEANAMLQKLGANAIDAFELGNEPELYGSFSWYRTPSGRHVRGRPRHYDFAAFAKDFSKVGSAIPAQIPLAGPGIGGGPKWTKPLPGFLAGEPRVKVVTMHRYGVNGCSRLVPITSLMSPLAQRGLALSVLTPTHVAHAHHAELRMEEMNTVSCGGQAGVSNTFAAALWLLDTLFEAARVGVDGVNVHTNPADTGSSTATPQRGHPAARRRKSSGLNSLFSFTQSSGRWHAAVRPEYYGMMMFVQAAPPGARLLDTSQGSSSPTLHTWATRAPEGTIHVILINESRTQRRTVLVRIPAVPKAGSLERLSAPRLSATGHVTLGGHSFGPSTATGLLPAPAQTTIARSTGGYTIDLPAASAAMLTFAKP